MRLEGAFSISEMRLEGAFSISEMRLEDVFSIFEMRLKKDRSLKEDVMIRNTEKPGYSQNIQVLHTLSPVFLDRRIEFSCNIYIIMAKNICNQVDIVGLLINSAAIAAPQLVRRYFLFRCDDRCVFLYKVFHAPHRDPLIAQGEK